MFKIKYFFINKYILIFFYVNDIVNFYEKKYFQQMKEFQNKFFQIYEMRYINKLQWFLKIHIIQDRLLRTLILYQNNYIDKLTIKFNVNTFFKASKALINSYKNKIIKNSNQTIAQQILKYQQHIKFINFAVVIIKSNIAFATFKLSEFLINSLFQYIKTVDKMFKYLIHIKDYEIVFNV